MTYRIGGFFIFETKMTVEWLLYVPNAVAIKHFALSALTVFIAFAGWCEFQKRQRLFLETAQVKFVIEKHCVF
jgi:hypothetical protein